MRNKTISFWISIPVPMSWWDRLLRRVQIEDVERISIDVECGGDLKFNAIGVSDPEYIIPYSIMIEEHPTPSPYVDDGLIAPPNPITNTASASDIDLISNWDLWWDDKLYD